MITALLLPFDLRAQSDEQTGRTLEQILELIDDALVRVRQGAKPCYDTHCQKTKTRLLARSKRLIDWLPEWDPDGVESLAFRSGYRLVDSPFLRPQKNDWLAWWKRRYQHEFRLRSSWPVLVQYMADLSSAFRYYQKIYESPSFFKEDFDTYWNNGLSIAAGNLKQAVKLTREASILELEGRELEAERTRERAQRKFAELRDWESEQGERISSIFRKLFPDSESAEALNFVLYLSTWADHFGESDIFHPDFARYLRDQEAYTKAIYRELQKFNDLEYGVIGLAQFSDPESPLRHLEEEIEIQKKIDRYEELFRIGIDTGVFFYMVGAANSIAAGSKLLSFGILAPSLYAKQKWNFDLSASILPSTSYTQELELYAFDLEQSMRRRHKNLKSTEAALLERQARVQAALSALEQSE